MLLNKISDINKSQIFGIFDSLSKIFGSFLKFNMMFIMV